MMKLSITDVEFTKLYYRDFTSAQKLLDELDGSIFVKHLEKIKLSYKICDSLILDLLMNISHFQSLLELDKKETKESQILFKDLGDLDVQKSFFSALSATSALIDHTRNFIKIYPMNGYDSKLIEIKENPYSHFIKNLRNYYSHYFTIKTEWEFQKDFLKNESKFKFILRKEELMLFSDWDTVSRIYIESQDKIDIGMVFSEYRKIVLEMYPWILSQSLISYNEIAHEYFRLYKLMVDNRAVSNDRLITTIISQHWDNNVVKYVNENFTESDKLNFLSLKFGSKEQISFFISILYRNQPMTKEDIDSIHEWFRKGINWY